MDQITWFWNNKASYLILLVSKQSRKGTQSVFLKQDLNNMIGNKETGMIYWIVTECPPNFNFWCYLSYLISLPLLQIQLLRIYTAKMVKIKLNKTAFWRWKNVVFRVTPKKANWVLAYKYRHRVFLYIHYSSMLNYENGLHYCVS